MKIVIYGKEDCRYCKNAVDLVREHNLPHKYYDVENDGVDIQVLTIKTAPGARTVPIVIIDDVWIGGYEELVKYIKQWKRYVSQLRGDLKAGKTISVVFIKKNGAVRNMNCTLNFDVIPADKHPTHANTRDEDSRDEYLFNVYDVDAKGWRAFRAETLVMNFDQSEMEV